MVFIGNLSVAFIAGVTFVYGALLVGDYKSGIFPAVFAFLFHLGREIVKDMQDLAGDMQAGAVTFAGKYGARAALRLVSVVFLLLTGILFLPFLYHIYNISYIRIVVPGVALVLIAIILLLWKNYNRKRLAIASAVLKIDMFIGLVAIYMGGRP